MPYLATADARLGDQMSDPLHDALQLIGAEAERANKLFPER